jgi:hypothetical protein
MSREILVASAGRNEISDAAHAVLDHLEAHEEEWANFHAWEGQIGAALTITRETFEAACVERPLAEIRAKAIEAAARLIDAVADIDCCIATGQS